MGKAEGPVKLRSADEIKERRRSSLQMADEKKKLQGSTEVIQDLTLTWINHYFKLHVNTDQQLSAGFPVIVLTMMDVIYPKKVRWHQVDWNTAYMRAVQRNHNVLEKIWYEVNMDKVKDLRRERVGTIEKMRSASCEEKLEFLKQVKRWFDCRVRHSIDYDPIKRRTEMEKQIRVSGRHMKFPAWMEHDKEEIQANRARKPDKNARSGTTEPEEFEQMPEFKRLLWFLGSSDHQTM
ncbi:unnamed protein product [Effrenium voratum]|nr:unnamed protein product [Effrenium voratum]